MNNNILIALTEQENNNSLSIYRQQKDALLKKLKERQEKEEIIKEIAETTLSQFSVNVDVSDAIKQIDKLDQAINNLGK